MKRNNLLLSICFFVSVFSVSAQNNATTTPTTKDNIEQSELLLAEAKIQTSGYSEGWSDGYKEGWCYEKGTVVIHHTPPIHHIQDMVKIPIREVIIEHFYKR
jgi:hypothetical protein